MRVSLLLFALFVRVFAGLIHAEEVTLTAVADTSLWQRATNHNLGATEMLPLGTTGDDGPGTKSRLLLKFDLTSIPDLAVVESANLKFRVVRSPRENARNSRFNGYKVLFDWGEGTKDFFPTNAPPLTSTQLATEGEATWTHREFGDPGEPWMEPGGSYFDEDFSEDISLTFFMLSQADRDYSIPLTPTGLDDINFWRTDPQSNFGWVVIGESENNRYTGRQIASRENTSAAYRPRLTIVYSVPGPTEPDIQSITKDENTVTVVYSAEAGVVYQPQYADSINDTLWTNLPDQGPLGADGTLQFTDDVSDVDERYYQITIPSP